MKEARKGFADGLIELLFSRGAKEPKQPFNVTDAKGRTKRRNLTSEQVDRLKAEGLTLEKAELEEIVPNRAQLRRSGLKQHRTGKPFARVPSGAPTGPGSAYTHFEQHYRRSETSGKKQMTRFPRTMVNSPLENQPLSRRHFL